MVKVRAWCFVFRKLATSMAALVSGASGRPMEKECNWGNHSTVESSLESSMPTRPSGPWSLNV